MVRAISNREPQASNRRRRSRYYMKHPGLRPLSSVNRPLSDTSGLSLNPNPSEDDLTINDIDLNIYKNAKKHHCERFDITMKNDPEKHPQVPKLVIRRGFAFEITIRLNRPYKKGKDKVAIQLAFGDRPKIPKKTLVRLPVESGGKSKEWTANMKLVNANELHVEVNSPADCFVGVWRLSCYVTYGSNATKGTKYKDIYMIFNPFNKDDEVFMNDANEREEYVMNDYGMLFIGTCETFSSRPWSFSQFYGHVLECAMYLLEESDLPYTDRGRPVQVSRRLAAMVNSSDDDGVLEGRWDGEYTGGIPPTDWQGSARILEQYWKTKKTVLYGQCWVFSGVMVTVCRALGIPCRSVTNYCSAHDTDSSVSVDHFYNENHEYEEYMNEDSIWNFHVWNEVFMTRPDLPVEAYSGWQALDATPQETSDGIFCCGPCPVSAIKKGDVTAKYDAPFIIAEVNADLIMWLKQKSGRYKMAMVATDEVGKRILTKQVNKMEVHDLTLEYKFKEGSAEERASMTKAMLTGSRGKDMIQSTAEDVESELIVDKDTALGADFTLKLVLKNTGNETRSLNGSMSVVSVYYTGVIAHELLKIPITFVLKAQATQRVSGVIRYIEYATKLKDHNNVTIRSVLEVDETKQVITMNKAFRLKKPMLDIAAPTSAKLNVMLTLAVGFKNILPKPLTRCTLYVDGSGLTPHLTMPQKDIGVGQMISIPVSIKPWSKGFHTLVCNLSCEQIRGIVGLHTIKVEKS